MSGERAPVRTVALAISVILNLFLAGVVAGRLTLPWFFHNAQATLVPREEIRQLPNAERTAFAEVIHRHSPEIKALHERVRDAKRAAEDAIGAPHYDRKLLEMRFAAVRQAQLAQGVAQHEAVIEALGTLSARSRAAIAQRAKEAVENAP